MPSIVIVPPKGWLKSCPQKSSSICRGYGRVEVSLWAAQPVPNTFSLRAGPGRQDQPALTESAHRGSSEASTWPHRTYVAWGTAHTDLRDEGLLIQLHGWSYPGSSRLPEIHTGPGLDPCLTCTLHTDPAPNFGMGGLKKETAWERPGSSQLGGQAHCTSDSYTEAGDSCGWGWEANILS